MLRAGRASVAIIAVLLSLAVVGPAAAVATEISCGQEIASAGVFTLASDLTCTTPITVSSGGVTVDLAGHLLSYEGTPAILISAIFSSPSHPVTVQNGTIRPLPPFAAGEDVYGKTAIFVQAGFATLQHLKIVENGIGLQLAGGLTRIQSNVIDHNRWGVVAQPGSGIEAMNNRIARNEVGIIASETRGGYIRDNVVALNTGTGISVNNAVPVIGNKLIHNGGTGVVLTSGEGPPGAQFQVAIDNLAIGNGGYGIWSQYPLVPSNSAGNWAAGNGSAPQCWNVVCLP